MKKHALICNLLYKKDTPDDRRAVLGMLKYYQYRDDRDRHVAQHPGLERWHDRDLGGSFRAVWDAASRLSEDRANKDEVLARLMVVSPHPDLMAEVPRGQRKRVLRELTETMMDRFFTACELPTPEYSYVIHDPATADGRQRLHAHVVFPATVPDIDGRQHYDLRRAQMPVFHAARDAAVTEVFTRLLGPERVAALDAALLTDAEKKRAERNIDRRLA